MQLPSPKITGLLALGIAGVLGTVYVVRSAGSNNAVTQTVTQGQPVLSGIPGSMDIPELKDRYLSYNQPATGGLMFGDTYLEGSSYVGGESIFVGGSQDRTQNVSFMERLGDLFRIGDENLFNDTYNVDQTRRTTVSPVTNVLALGGGMGCCCPSAGGPEFNNSPQFYQDAYWRNEYFRLMDAPPANDPISVAQRFYINDDAELYANYLELNMI